MRVDRVIDWNNIPVYIVRDWIDFGNNVGIEIKVNCSYKGSHDDWLDASQDYSLLVPMKKDPDLNVFGNYAKFKRKRQNWLTETFNATTIGEIKKSDPIFKYGYNSHKCNIVEHIFEIRVIK